MEDKEKNLVWIDLEMTGLEDEHVIIEIASLVTDSHLNELAEGPVIAVSRTKTEMDGINEWSLEQHTKSGLLKRCEASTIDITAAEKQTIDFLESWTVPEKSPICGDSIATDRRFIRKEMPLLDQYLHYRMLDVSTVKEIVERWYPDLEAPPKQWQHLALVDITASIPELQWYKNHVFNPGK
mgnify:FL=1